MRPSASFVIPSGGRADGTQQRLRYGLGEFRPYRYKGRPGWNPAAVLDGWSSGDRQGRPCPRCGVAAGERCRTRGGTVMAKTSHDGR